MRVMFLFWRLPEKLIISYAPAGRRPRRKSTQTDPAWREASPSDNADYRRSRPSTGSSRQVGCRRFRRAGSGGQDGICSKADSSTTRSSTCRSRGPAFTNGHFDGLVAVTLSSAYFQKFYEKIAL